MPLICPHISLLVISCHYCHHLTNVYYKSPSFLCVPLDYGVSGREHLSFTIFWLLAKILSGLFNRASRLTKQLLPDGFRSGCIVAILQQSVFECYLWNVGESASHTANLLWIIY